MTSDSDSDEAFKFMHQSIITKTKNSNSASEDWVVKTIVKYSIKNFECYYKQK